MQHYAFIYKDDYLFNFLILIFSECNCCTCNKQQKQQRSNQGQNQNQCQCPSCRCKRNRGGNGKIEEREAIKQEPSVTYYSPQPTEESNENADASSLDATYLTEEYLMEAMAVLKACDGNNQASSSEYCDCYAQNNMNAFPKPENDEVAEWNRAANAFHQQQQMHQEQQLQQLADQLREQQENEKREQRGRLEKQQTIHQVQETLRKEISRKCPNLESRCSLESETETAQETLLNSHNLNSNMEDNAHTNKLIHEHLCMLKRILLKRGITNFNKIKISQSCNPLPQLSSPTRYKSGAESAKSSDLSKSEEQRMSQLVNKLDMLKYILEKRGITNFDQFKDEGNDTKNTANSNGTNTTPSNNRRCTSGAESEPMYDVESNSGEQHNELSANLKSWTQQNSANSLNGTHQTYKNLVCANNCSQGDQTIVDLTQWTSENDMQACACSKQEREDIESQLSSKLSSWSEKYDKESSFPCQQNSGCKCKLCQMTNEIEEMIHDKTKFLRIFGGSNRDQKKNTSPSRRDRSKSLEGKSRKNHFQPQPLHKVE